jgi:galactoside O-acetyltransferase
MLPTDIGVKIRYWAYRPLFKRVLGKFYVARNVKIEGFENITLGKNVALSYGSNLFANNANLVIGDNCVFGINSSIGAVRSDIKIGKSCMIGANCSLISDSHIFTDTDVYIMEQGYEVAEIVIGNDVWITTNCVITKGVEIGEGSIVSPCSVVSSKIPPYSIAIGNPARVVVNRKVLLHMKSTTTHEE